MAETKSFKEIVQEEIGKMQGNGSALKATQESLPISENSRNLISKYGNRTNFLSTFHCNKQPYFSQFPDRCHFGSAPTLTMVNSSYGAGTAEEWLVYQLADLSEYCGARDKLTGMQIRQLATNIRNEFGWMNVAELMLFFYRFKLGHYGHFYGSVDPIIITKTLRTDFMFERADATQRHKQMEYEKEMEEWRKTAVTYDEFIRLKEDKSHGIQD